MAVTVNTFRAFAAAAALLVEIIPASALSPAVRRAERRWTPALPTNAAVSLPLELGGISPVPTEAPRRPGPDFAGMEPFKRDYTMGTDTCGFAADLKSEPWTCFRLSATCATTGSVMGCCVGSEPDCFSTFATTCIGFQTRSACSSGGNTLCCPRDLPACMTWEFSGSKTPGSTFTLYNCYASGQGGTSRLVDAPPGLTLTTSPTSSSQSNGQSTAGTSSPTDSPTEGAGPAPGSGSSSTNVGAIVGGAVGGVAVIGLVIVAVVWMVVRNRRAKAAAVAAPPAPGSTNGGGGLAASGAHHTQKFPSSAGGSPAQGTVAPSTLSPQMSQAGYFPVATTPPPPQPQMASYEGYHDVPKPQPSPGLSDPRYSVMTQHYTGNIPSETVWTATPGAHQQPPTELGTTNPVGTQANPAQLS